jgi:polyketide cyclase/dehydrase/lipid transport protein
MRTWTAHATTEARPEDILAALTNPDRCRDWAPVAFEVDDDTSLLQTGTRTRVNGKLAGMRVGFDVEVHRADARRLQLTARGPVHMDVDYDVAPTPDGTEVHASVSVLPGRGLLSKVMAEATAGLLGAGALTAAVERLTRCAVAA